MKPALSAPRCDRSRLLKRARTRDAARSLSSPKSGAVRFFLNFTAIRLPQKCDGLMAPRQFQAAAVKTREGEPPGSPPGGGDIGPLYSSGRPSTRAGGRAPRAGVVPGGTVVPCLGPRWLPRLVAAVACLPPRRAPAFCQFCRSEKVQLTLRKKVQ